MTNRSAEGRFSPLRRGRLLACAALAVSLMAGRALAQPARNFEIASQPLDQALLQFSKQADIDVSASATVTRGKTGRRVAGPLTPQAALERLLEGTGLKAQTGAGGGLVVVPDAPVPFGPGGGSTAANDDEADTLEEVVVTAQKRTENVKDVPAAITVLSARRLETLGASQLDDYAGYVPGMVVNNQGTPGQNRIIIRGIAAATGSATVGAYIDDSPLGSSSGSALGSLMGLDVNPYDLERVEILRGPQGTLYGASTMGGLLKYVTRAPDLYRYEGRVGAEVSSIHGADDLGWALRAGGNAPLVEGKLAVRASVFRQDTPGYIDNADSGVQDENAVRQTGARIAVLWKPVDDLSIRLAAMRQDIETDGQAEVLFDLNLKPLLGDLTSSHPLPQGFDQQLGFYTATLQWDFGWADLTSASSYSRYDSVISLDISETYGPLLPLFGGSGPGYADLISDPKVKKYTQEFRLASKSGGRFEWLVGAFYTDEAADYSQVGHAYGLDFEPMAGLETLFSGTLDTRYREFAAFGNVTYRFTDQFDITAGLRWASNKQRVRTITDGVLFGGVREETVRNSSDEVVTYNVSPRFFVSKDTMVYGRVASSYRPGGPNAAFPGVPGQYDADTLVNYELGVKSTFLAGKASIDAALFRIDWKDMQAFMSTGGGIAFIGNAGAARSQGVEIATLFAPVRGLTVGLNLAYTDAQVTEDVASLGAQAGDRIPWIPEWSGSATLNYEFPINATLTGRFGGGFRYGGERVTNYPGALGLPVEHSGMVDANASISTDRWELRLYAKNLSDERVLSVGAPRGLGFVGTVNQPRTIGLVLEARF
jgi:iron complex outermembrane receptor protein